MKAPCKDCERRHPGCHSKCEEYQTFRKANEEMHERVYQEKRLMTDNEISRRKTRIYYNWLKRKKH